jgi:alpha-L-fucosidase
MVEGDAPVPVVIQRIPRVTTQRIRLSFESSRDTPHIAEVGAYDEP